MKTYLNGPFGRVGERGGRGAAYRVYIKNQKTQILSGPPPAIRTTRIYIIIMFPSGRPKYIITRINITARALLIIRLPVSPNVISDRAAGRDKRSPGRRRRRKKKNRWPRRRKISRAVSRLPVMQSAARVR